VLVRFGFCGLLRFSVELISAERGYFSADTGAIRLIEIDQPSRWPIAAMLLISIE